MIRIHTFGGLSVRGEGDKPISGAAAQPRRMAILALLARAGERGMTREKVLALLWPDADDERGPRTLAQALYALRKDLGSEEAVAGARELYLDPATITSDVSEFAAAVARGDDERAVSLYHGPFLDGFRLTGADEFMRWVERERGALAQDYFRALESLARAAHAKGDPVTAVSWWRQLAAIEPLNARVTVGLMEALAASGDRAGALKHVRVYELLVEQELDLPPDREVMAVAERLRQGTDDGPAVAGAPLPTRVAEPLAPPPVVESPAKSTPNSSLTTHPDPWRGTPITIAALIVVAVGFLALRPRSTSSSDAGGMPVVAIGHIAAFGGDSAHASLAAPLADLLSTSLGRSRGIRVVSQGRMLELMKSGADTGAAAFIDAARRAGASEVIDGTLHERPDGGLRLDLRRVRLATGAIGDAQSVEGRDLFALVDSGTARLVSALGTDAPSGSVTEVTTHSMAAYRLYEQCVHAFNQGEYLASLALCDDALTADSMFALAAYYGALAATHAAPASWPQRMERAKALATRVPDRERLTITADWAYRTSSPALRSAAESLALRYPSEVEGNLYTGIARIYDGEFASAVAPLQRVVSMDSSGLGGARTVCPACEAYRWWVSTLIYLDSLPAAERVARTAVRLQPGSWSAALPYIEVLQLSGRFAEADSTTRALAPPDLPYDDMVLLQAEHALRAGDFETVDRLLNAQLKRGGDARTSNALWDLSLSLRERGRINEALELARRLRRFGDTRLPRNQPQALNVLEAQLLLESGRPALSAALFDSIAKSYPSDNTPSQTARHYAWMKTHAAGARLAAGDTSALSALADSIRASGAASGYGRDQRLHHHVRGLQLLARGQNADAATEFRAGIYSTTVGYTRTNLELSRALVRDGRPREAVAVLQSALRGPLEGSNLYVIRTELHEALAQSWDAAESRDSAVVHYDAVAQRWSAGDPAYKARAAAARTRADALRQAGR